MEYSWFEFSPFFLLDWFSYQGLKSSAYPNIYSCVGREEKAFPRALSLRWKPPSPGFELDLSLGDWRSEPESCSWLWQGCSYLCRRCSLYMTKVLLKGRTRYDTIWHQCCRRSCKNEAEEQHQITLGIVVSYFKEMNGQLFSWIQLVWIQCFPFPKLVVIPKLKNPACLTIYSCEDKREGFMLSFRTEFELGFFKSILYGDNHYIICKHIFS